MYDSHIKTLLCHVGRGRTLTSLKESARRQVSMLRQVADLYNLSSYDMVTVNRISKKEEPSVVKAVSAARLCHCHHQKEQYIDFSR